jgi:hypothetical protein
MPTLELTPEEWQALTVMLTKQPWELANPILYKMARQGFAQSASAAVTQAPLRPDGAGQIHFPPRDE